MENIKSFFKDKKNLTIAILSFLLLICILTIGESTPSENQLQEINTLNNKITELEQEKQELNNNINELENNISSKEKEINSLNEKITKLENENAKTTTTSSTQSTKTTSSTNTSYDKTEEMVWVGETGTKYHTQNCRTLKGNGHQITLKQALSEGRQACKVCH